MNVWLVYCPNCGGYTTVASSPKSASFVEVISCSICDRRVNAKNGTYNTLVRIRNIKVEEKDLLEIV